MPAKARLAWNARLNDLFKAADEAIAGGATILILSDKGVDRAHAPIPALLATAGLHHHLIRAGTRTRVGLVLESGEPREVHHFCLLIGYGAQAINPYLVYECLNDMIHQGLLQNISYHDAVKGYDKAVLQGRGQSDGEDGHLDHQVLLRRANFRSRGVGPRAGR